MHRILAVLALALSACPPDPCAVSSSAAAERVQPALPPLPMTGRATRYAVRALSCDPSLVSATSEVKGPQGELVPSTVVSFSGATATVEFTALTPGAHTLTVTFQPTNEHRIINTWAPRERSAEPVLRLPTTAPCMSVAVSRGGAVCLAPNQLTLSGSSLTRSLPSGAMLTTAGDVVWEYDSFAVRRLERTDDAGWSLLEGPASPSLRIFVSGASERSLLLSDDGRLVEYAPDGDGGLTTSEPPLPSDSFMTAGLAVTDAGVVYLRGTEVCFGEQNGSARCREWGQLELLAAEGDGLWLSNTTQEVGFARFTTSTAPVSLQFFRPDPDVAAQLLRTDAQVGLRYPAFDYAPARTGPELPPAFTLALTGDPLVLEAWERPQGTVASGVTPRHVWFRVDGELLLFAR